MHSSKAIRTGGFTLLEMIIVLVVAGLAASLLLARGPMHAPALELRVAAETLAAELREGRAIATATQQAVVFLTTPGGNYGLSGHTQRTLPVGMTLQVPARIVFFPDGSTSAGTIVLASPAGRMAITVDRLTGHVAMRQITS